MDDDLRISTNTLLAEGDGLDLLHLGILHDGISTNTLLAEGDGQTDTG